jgi:integrase
MLTDTQIRQFKPSEKARRYWDERGLYLEVSPSGGKLWRFKYKFNGKEKRISLGIYPDTGLKEAREQRDAARKLLASSIDPSVHRQSQRAARALSEANTFGIVAREWLSKYSPSWAKSHTKTVIQRLEKDIFPRLGERPIAEITAQELLVVLRKVEARGAVETAHRELAVCGQIFRYAIATGRAERDLSSDLRGALAPVKNGHFAAITDPKRLGEVLRILDSYTGSFVVQCALKLAPMLFVRPGELRCMRWREIDFEKAEWRFQASKTKTDHIVPLPRQAIRELLEIQPLTDCSDWVFPNARSTTRPMSEVAVLAAFRALGIDKEELSGHGFRATARTLLDEVLALRVEVIEMQLGHQVRDMHGTAYNRTRFLEERRSLMQSWADYLDRLRGVL